MSTLKQDKDFLEAMTDSGMLEKAIDWIASNLEPEDVFREDELRRWALNNGMVDDNG